MPPCSPFLADTRAKSRPNPTVLLEARRQALVIGKVRARLEKIVPMAKIIHNGYRGKVIAERAQDGVRSLVPICTISKVSDGGIVSHHMCADAHTRLGMTEQQLTEAVDGGIADAAIRPLR